MASRTLLVISAREDAAHEAAEAGVSPRKDFHELALALDADVLGMDRVLERRGWRLLQTVVGMPITQAIMAFRKRHKYDAIFCDGEHVGIPLALLLYWSGRRPRFGFIGHLLSTPLKRGLFRVFHPQRAIDYVVLHAVRQRDLAERDLGLRTALLKLVPYQVDARFWAASAAGDGDAFICAAGLEYRDYSTLVRAIAGLPVRVRIAAGSRWSRHRFDAEGRTLPLNVEVGAVDYPELRNLYDRARFVVVPLVEGDNQAGVTTILEAMAMSKAVIVTATRGQRDVVRGRLWTGAGPVGPAIGGPAAFGLSGPVAQAETGVYVTPSDPMALRGVIEYLLNNPEKASALGAAGRRLVEEWMALDRFVPALAELIAGGCLAAGA